MHTPKNDKILLTDAEKAIVKKLNHNIYTIDFLEEWINRKDNVFTNAPAALQSCTAHGFYQAVKAMADYMGDDISWVTDPK